MGMTDKQYNGFVRLILNVITKALRKMPDCDEKEDLQKLAEDLQKSLES